MPHRRGNDADAEDSEDLFFAPISSAGATSRRDNECA
jgi:hypothetical protein